MVKNRDANIDNRVLVSINDPTNLRMFLQFRVAEVDSPAMFELTLCPDAKWWYPLAHQLSIRFLSINMIEYRFPRKNDEEFDQLPERKVLVWKGSPSVSVLALEKDDEIKQRMYRWILSKRKLRKAD